MKEKLTEYLDRLFDETPPTKRAVELKEEMYRNMLEKYDDLLAAGREPQDAFDLVIASVGDPTELFRSLAIVVFVVLAHYVKIVRLPDTCGLVDVEI